MVTPFPLRTATAGGPDGNRRLAKSPLRRGAETLELRPDFSTTGNLLRREQRRDTAAFPGSVILAFPRFGLVVHVRVGVFPRHHDRAEIDVFVSSQFY